MPAMDGHAGHSEISVDRWLRWGIAATCLVVLALVVELMLSGSQTVVFVPLVLLAAPAVALAVAHPTAGLIILFGLFVMSTGTAPGVGVREILFGAVYIPYLATWYFTRLFVYREPIVVQRGDAALILFAAIVLASTVAGSVAGHRVSVLVSELGNFSLLAFYFPFRELCVRHRQAAWWLMLAVLAMGVLLVGRNLADFGLKMARATEDWEIAGGRVAASEVMLMASALAGGIGYLYTSGKLRKAVVFGGFVFAVSGLVLTQFRAYYLGLAIALVIVFLMADRRRRVQLVSSAVLGLLGVAALLYIILGDALHLLMLGLSNRMLSIGTAATHDVSLINRFLEYQDAIKLILARPFIGYGAGSEFGFYDSIYQFTWVKPYIHNAYLHLWYKFGLFGVSLFCYMWGLAIWRGYVCARRGAEPVERAPAMFVLAMLTGLAVTALVSVLFNSDSTMVFAICFAIAAGLHWRLGGPTERAGVAA